VQAYAALPGDLYLLCTDGLHGPCSPGAIAAAHSVAHADSLHTVCASLVDMAKHDGSRDNITALLLHIPA